MANIKITKAMKLIFLQGIFEAKVKESGQDKKNVTTTEELKQILRCIMFTLKDKFCSFKWASVDPNIELLWRENKGTFPYDDDKHLKMLKEEAKAFEGKYTNILLPD